MLKIYVCLEMGVNNRIVNFQRFIHSINTPNSFYHKLVYCTTHPYLPQPFFMLRQIIVITRCSMLFF